MTDLTVPPRQSQDEGAPGKANLAPLGEALLFLGRRLLLGLVVLLAVVFIAYLGFAMSGGVPLGDALGQAVQDTLFYTGRLLQGEMGLTATARDDALSLPVTEVLPPIMARSLGLLAVSLLFAALVGVLLGVRAATRDRSGRSLTILLASIIGISAPSFFLALLLQRLLIFYNRQTGDSLLPLGGFGWDNHLILPALVLAGRPIAQITRVTFITVAEALRQDYVRTARSKGLKRRHVIWRHVFRNASVSVLTTIVLSLRFSLSSLPVVEFFFGWPGAGFNLLKAISQQDKDLAVGLLLALGAFFIVVNVLLEGLYRLIDPRLREIPDHIAAGERQTVRQAARALWTNLRDLVRNNPLTRWWRRRTSASEESPFRAVLERSGRVATHDPDATRRFSGRLWLRGTVGNVPFVLGLILVVGLVVLFAFGPQLTPHSPYTTRGLEYKDGEFFVPPFAPGAEYPWGTDVLGRDIMSLILAGAQQTLLLAVLVVAARMVLGFFLGVLAGWWQGSWLDRLVLGTAEVIAAFPTLLLAMLLILSLGIREGFRPFLIALSVTGWAETMQYVRGEVMALRPAPFVESAVASGARTGRIILVHLLPNLLSVLISLAALEMGALLMLLGELGFIGIFIGGGAFAELDTFGDLYHYSDVPEWGSLLSNVRAYAIPYPWTAVYPSLAFFVAILAFNLFGEGMRRLVDTVGVQFNRLVNRYTVAALALLLLGAGWVRSNSGPMGFYRQQAVQFEGERAEAHVAALTAPEMQGRALGSEGLLEAAEYIADQFEELGLQPAGEEFTYFQSRGREYETVTSVPELAVDDGGAQPVYREAYALFPSPFRSLGSGAGTVTFFASGDLTESNSIFGFSNFPALAEKEFPEQVVLVLSPTDALRLRRNPRAGILVVTDDESLLQRQFTLSGRDPTTVLFGTGRRIGVEAPTFWITEELANRLLSDTGMTVSELRTRAERLEQDELLIAETDTRVEITIDGTTEEVTGIPHVTGHLPGISADLDSQMILVMAQYDAPPLQPDGRVVPGANDNASSIGLMLELIRTMRDSGYQPSKTFLFVAYAGEGTEGGGPVYPPNIERFLAAKYGFSSAFTIEAVVDLRGVGAGSGDALEIGASGSQRLVNVLEEAAKRMDVPTTRAAEAIDLSIIFDERSIWEGGQEAPQIGVRWEGWQDVAQTPEDTLEAVSTSKLEQVGKALTLALMTIGRETQY